MKNQKALDKMRKSGYHVEDFMSSGSIIHSTPSQTCRLICKDEVGSDCTVEEAVRFGAAHSHAGNMHHPPDYEEVWFD